MGKLSDLFGSSLEHQLNPKYRFEEFFEVYPKRRGGSPRALSEKKYIRAINDGADHNHLVSSARKFGEELRAQNKIGTEFVPMASTWLNQKRWIDYAPDDATYVSKSDTFMREKGWEWSGKRWVKTRPDAEDLL